VGDIFLQFINFLHEKGVFVSIRLAELDLAAYHLVNIKVNAQLEIFLVPLRFGAKG